MATVGTYTGDTNNVGDFFTYGLWPHRATDTAVATLNNYFQDLWRASVEAGLSVEDLAALDYDMQGFLAFKARYDEAIFRRAADPFAIWGEQADLETELAQVWLPRFTARMQALTDASADVESGLVALGVDVESLSMQITPEEAGIRDWGIYIGVAVAVGLVGIGILLARNWNRTPARS